MPWRSPVGQPAWARPALLAIAAVAFAVEGCTGWRYVAEELALAGIAAHLAEPADTAFARGRKRHAKTDKTDCRHLRMLLAEGRLPECWIPPGHILECRALLELYHDLRAEHAAVGAGHWAACRWQRALAAWASSAASALAAWGLGTEAPTRAEMVENTQQHRDALRKPGTRLPPEAPAN